MHAPSQTLHWLKKELRENKWYLVILSVLLLANIGLGYWLATLSPISAGWKTCASAIQTSAWLFLLLLLFRIIYTENPFDENLFWQSRPISGAAIFRAKLLLSLTVYLLGLSQTLVFFGLFKDSVLEASFVAKAPAFFTIGIAVWNMASIMVLFVTKGKMTMDFAFLSTLFVAGVFIPFLLIFAVFSLSHLSRYSIFIPPIIWWLGSWLALLHQSCTRNTEPSWTILLGTWLIPLVICVPYYLAI